MAVQETIRTVIIDDAADFRLILKKMLSAFPEIEIAGEASSFESAITLVEEVKPEVVFLDIDLDGNNSIELFNGLNLSDETQLIFTTAHADYAVQAFELEAVDYLIKPIKPERLRKTIERLIRNEAPATDGSPLETEEKYTMDRAILLKYDHKMAFEKLENIVYITSLGNYTKIYLDNSKVAVVYSSMKNWESKLPTEYFVRIHRGTILNLQYVDKVIRWNNDSGRAYLKNVEVPLEISRSYFSNLKSKFKL